MTSLRALFPLLLLTGCVAADEEPRDPAGDLAGDVWDDEGPLPADESSDIDGAVDAPDAIFAPPRFQVPFPCGQVWAGQTRTNHSPTSSIDFNRSYDEGDAVVAAAAGKVTRVANTGSTSYGRWIEIGHGNGFTTRYAHLSSQAVSVGQQVAQGQRIGAVGSTGGSTGPHLHYEQRHNGVAMRPVFDGQASLFFGTRNYTSRNGCGGAGVTGTVNTAGPSLTVRTGPGTSYAAVGSVSDGTYVTISCQKRGQSVTGTYGTSTLWDKIGAGYVADAYVRTGSDGQVAPSCP